MGKMGHFKLDEIFPKPGAALGNFTQASIPTSTCRVGRDSIPSSLDRNTW